MKNIALTSAAFLVALTGFSQTHANSFEKKTKEYVAKMQDSVNNELEKLGEDFDEIQNYLENYPWKGILQDKVSSGAVTLKHLYLNDHPKVLCVKPGERIEGKVHCHLDKDQCSSLSMYRVVLGFVGEDPQTTIGNELGIVAGHSKETFTLIAPSKPGIYQLRFRLVDSFFKGKALDAWKDEKGNEPDASTTIGIVVVKS